MCIPYVLIPPSKNIMLDIITNRSFSPLNMGLTHSKETFGHVQTSVPSLRCNKLESCL